MIAALTASSRSGVVMSGISSRNLVVTAKILRKDGQAWRQRPLVAGSRPYAWKLTLIRRHEYARPAPRRSPQRTRKLASLGKRDLAADPIVQFNKWMDEAIKAELPEPTAMNLATVSAQGRPSRASCRS